ncbi:MAG TPA: hypothetical protein VHF69_04695, partial [Candidatus Synoicihabitans sp.]|nr:hypothetical protein [Candidatus Synoicihabitans sp.]
MLLFITFVVFSSLMAYSVGSLAAALGSSIGARAFESIAGRTASMVELAASACAGALLLALSALLGFRAGASERLSKLLFGRGTKDRA